jgi:hypothetical protein
VKVKPRFAEKVAGLSAIALVGFLFLDWFEGHGVAVTSAPGFQNYAPTAEGISGWDSLGWLALVLCLLAVVAGLACAIVFSTHESPVLPVFTAICALLLGGLAAIALLVQVICQPGTDEYVSVQAGWWLGFLAACGISRGGFLSMRDEYLPGVPIPEVPVRPAPAA